VNAAQFQIQLIAVLAASACAVLGVFLVLRRMVMMSDAISHTVLLGIVLGFFLTGDLASPYLVIGAALTGLLTVTLVEVIFRTRLVKEDAAIGLVFPALFSIAVILISRYAGQVHLDTDAVLLGELAYAPFDRFAILGRDLGPVGIYLMGGILLINLAFIAVFYKELKLATFDAGLAATLGFAPALIHYLLMGLVSVTAVSAFEVVGSVLLVALMVAPPITAYLLTDRLPRMLGLSIVFGAAAAISGYWVAHWLDASIAGSMAAMAGLFFGVAWMLAPERGLVAMARRRKGQRWEFAQTMLAIHLLNHEGLPEAWQESRLDHLQEHMRWEPSFSDQVIQRAVAHHWVERVNGHLVLTEEGRQRARQVLST
jgi:manganese/zinc/iron transport system permease protein